MRAALRLFEAALPLQESTRLRRELWTLGALLGKVRDLDVQIPQLVACRAALINVGPEAATPLLHLLLARREQAREELFSFLDSRRFALLCETLSQLLRDSPTAGRPAARLPIRAAGPTLIRREYRKLVRLARGIEGSSPPTTYHQARIRGKRLRYALEFLEPAYGPPARELITPLIEFQDLLGCHQDDQVSMALLRELSESAALPDSTRLAIGEMAQLSAAHAEKLRGDFPRVWSLLCGKRWRRWRLAAKRAATEFSAETMLCAKERLRSPRAEGMGPETTT
jgi:CHAD domain-containing protein